LHLLFTHPTSTLRILHVIVMIDVYFLARRGFHCGAKSL
jgi:hypothetical protein